MHVVMKEIEVLHNVPIPTWFGVGGAADSLVRPRNEDDVRRALLMDADARVLGDGANLLVDDDGVRELVIDLKGSALKGVEIERSTGRVIAQAGADLPRLILEVVRAGLSGLEGLGGIPATVGGAAVMNAGGAFGQIADVVVAVEGYERTGSRFRRERGEVPYSYRHSGLHGLILTRVELQLTPADPKVLRDRLKEVMAYKKSSQPMADHSAGCCFKNPTLPRDLSTRDGAAIGKAGSRISAGMLIDMAGCKGLRIRGAEVSFRHGNFLVAHEGARARDVIELMDEVARRVRETFGVELEREVVVWRRVSR